MKSRLYTLKELVRIKYGKNQQKVVSDEGHVPIYGTGGLMGYAKDFLYDKPSVLIGRKGTIGKVKYVDHPFWTVDTLFYTEVNEEIVLPKFLFYLMSQLDLNIYNEGTTIPSLRTETLNRLEFCIPPLPIQQKIASILTALDDKIETNNAICRNLEEQAMALYKSWFVDYSHNENGDFDESEIGLIPKGWYVTSMSEYFPVITGKKNANISSEHGKYPFFSCSQESAWTDEYSFDGRAILVAGNGDFNIKRYYGKFEAYQRTYVLMPFNSELTGFLYYALALGLSNITVSARGSVIKFITKGNIANYKIAVPSNLIKLPIITEINSLNAMIDNLKGENLILTSMRNSLLPKLMSGEIDLSTIN